MRKWFDLSSLEYEKLAERYPWWVGPWRLLFNLTALIFRFVLWKTRQFSFTTNWAESRFPLWEKMLTPYAGKPNLRYLEVGCFEGRSMLWMFDYILTHRSSRAVAVDVFGPVYAFRFLRNLVRSGHMHQVQLRPGYSKDILRGLRKHDFDIVYLDGSHVMADVMIDLCLSWDLLKPGGMMIVDDYKIGQDVLPIDMRPSEAVDAFILAFGGDIEVLHLGIQAVIRKRQEKKSGRISFAFGNSNFDWYRKTLSVGDGPRQHLSEEECAIFDRHVQQIGVSYGHFAPPISPELAQILRDRGAEI